MFSRTGVLLPILTASQRVGFRPNVDRLWVTLCWITVLKAELEAATHPDVGVFVFLAGEEIKALIW